MKMDYYEGRPSFVSERNNTRYVVIDDSELKVLHREPRSGVLRCACSLCGSTRTHHNDPSLAIFESTGIGTCFHCIQNGCDAQGYMVRVILRSRLRTYERFERDTATAVPQRLETGKLQPVHSEAAVEYLRGRGITDLAALDGLVYETEYRFRGTRQPETCLAYVYCTGTKIVNVQYRRITVKDFAFAQGGAVIAFNQNACIGNTEIIITEGPQDAVVLCCLGHKNVISVPNGAGTDVEKVFGPYRMTHYDHLKTVYIAGDSDEAGLKLRERLAEYFGQGRCRIVEWDYFNPDDRECNFTAKDANECLLTAERMHAEGKGVTGRKAVEWCLANAKVCDSDVLETAADYEAETDYWRTHGEPQSYGTGMFNPDRNLRFQEGRMMLLSGEPGAGKSTYALYVALKLAIRNGWRVAVWSPEKYPTAYLYKELFEMLTGYAFGDIPQGLYGHAKRWCNRNFTTLNPKGNAVKDVLDAAHKAVMEMDVKFLILDPFNYFSKPREYGMSDPDKVGEMIQQVVEFARRDNVCTMLVAHPRKPGDPGGDRKPPSLYDVSGSADFYNKPDVGIWVERDRHNSLTYVHVLKVRFKVLGEVGTFALWYDEDTHRYGECVSETAPGGSAVTWTRWALKKGSIMPDEDNAQEELFDS
jgi:twinkle protein